MSEENEDAITVRLTRAEALVLFEWLVATSEGKGKALPFADHAEQVVLWSIEAQLERVLVEPLQGNYADRVTAARKVVRGPRR